MIRVLAPVFAFCALAFCAPAASASDVTVADASRIPTPHALVITAACPDMDGQATAGACSFPDGRVYLPAGTDQFARQHELGHIFDAQYLDAGERNRATRLLGFPAGTPWRNGTGLGGFDSPHELFADAYAACRLGLDPMSEWETSYDYAPTRRELRAMCGFIRRAAR